MPFMPQRQRQAPQSPFQTIQQLMMMKIQSQQQREQWEKEEAARKDNFVNEIKLKRLLAEEQWQRELPFMKTQADYERKEEAHKAEKDHLNRLKEIAESTHKSNVAKKDVELAKTTAVIDALTKKVMLVEEQRKARAAQHAAEKAQFGKEDASLSPEKAAEKSIYDSMMGQGTSSLDAARSVGWIPQEKQDKQLTPPRLKGLSLGQQQQARETYAQAVARLRREKLTEGVGDWWGLNRPKNALSKEILQSDYAVADEFLQGRVSLDILVNNYLQRGIFHNIKKQQSQPSIQSDSNQPFTLITR